MASELQVQTISGPPTGANANKILLGSGQQIVAEAGGLVAPGQVVQVVQAYTTAQETNSQDSAWVRLGPQVVITPKNTSNKILLTFSYQISNHTNYLHELAAIYRNATLVQPLGLISYANHGTDSVEYLKMEWLDSPNSTSALTYEMRFKHTVSNAGTFYVNDQSNTPDVNYALSVITAMEIAA